jgi:RHS repeat-associated protein
MVDEDNAATSADHHYCHDARNQLTGRGSTAACGTSDIETFSYDDAGNRSQAVEGGTTRNFAYTTAGLLCDVETGAAASCTGGNIGSDDAGRISDHAGWHFDYDASARLVAACDNTSCAGSGFDRVDFSYDGEGHRTAIVATPAAGSPVVTTTFRYQGDAIVAESVGGTLTREYMTDDSGTISKVIVPTGGSAGTYLVTWNGHGDAMALHRIETNGTLTLANSYTYSTWGTPTTTTHNGIADLGFRFLYVGAYDVQWDDQFGLGLTYMHARHYSPTLGRFLQPDPSRLDAEFFVYTENSPVTKVDPTGLCPWCVVGLLLVVGLAIDTIDYVANTPSQQQSVQAWVDRVWPGVAASFIPGGRIFSIGGRAISAAARAVRSRIPSAVSYTASYTAYGISRAYGAAVWRGSRGTTVLGTSIDGYADLAAALGARSLHIPKFLWTAMSRSHKWMANKAFLDSAIRRGDSFRLATRPFAPNLTGLFGEEVKYMLSRGYVRVYRNGSWWLVR